MTRRPFDPTRIKAKGETPARAHSGVVTVAQVTAMVKSALSTALPATLHVVGEISNFKRHGSGHLYLTLKDAFSELSCVMWRSQAASLKFAPADGMEVIATGQIDVFERAGRYQLYVRKLEPRGAGALDLAFRQLCEKLSAEGLFAPEHKKPIPRFPVRVALVTSPTGAAVQDMLRTIQRRYPCVEVLLYPVRVQGDGAAGEVARAIQGLNKSAGDFGGIDLMIVGRGGGSLEDLWAFNEEVVARAIFASRIPVISAVGHESDVTVADLVADLRAATPTAAAELAVPVLAEVHANLDAYSARLRRSASVTVDRCGSRLDRLCERSAFKEPLRLVEQRGQIVDEIAHRLYRLVRQRVQAMRERVDRLEEPVHRIAPHAVLLQSARRLIALESRLRGGMDRRLAVGQRQSDALTRRLERIDPGARLEGLSTSVAHSRERIERAVRHRLALVGSQVERQAQRLGALSYKSILNRGFSITRTKRGRKLVRSVKQLDDRARIETEVADGSFESEVVNLKQLELFE